MSSKTFVFAAFVAVARAGILQHTAVVAPVAAAVVDSEYDHNPQYTFGYGVHDSITGDSKSQVETRSGDVVHGSYSLNDPDGTRRTVDYTADAINGFNAVVRKTPLAHATGVLTPVVAKGGPEFSGAVPVASAAAEVAPVSNVEVAPVVAGIAPGASVSHTSSSVVHNNAPILAQYATAIGLSAYSTPIVSHLAYSGLGPLTYGFVHPSLYSPLPHYKAVHYLHY